MINIINIRLMIINIYKGINKIIKGCEFIQKSVNLELRNH